MGICLNSKEIKINRNRNIILKEIKKLDIKATKNLLSSVKSNYIFKTIFSFLDEKKKLNMIIYNKIFQRKFGFNIELYKTMSGILHNGGRNGYGTEILLDTKVIIFEGEYKNNKRHGKGKEFYFRDGKLKFEGEYLNGYKIKGKGYNENGKINLMIGNNRKGKEYYNNGKLKFEGEYLYGKKWNGKGYNINGFIEYIIKNGSGFAKEYDYKDRLLYIHLIFNTNI